MKNLMMCALLAAALVGCGSPSGNDGGGSGGGSGGSSGCADPTAPEYSCDSGTTLPDGGTTVKTGDLWTAVVSPRCISTCHKPGGADVSYGDYSTATVFQTGEVGVKSLYAGSKATLKRVDPNNLQNSAVWLKVLGGGPGGKKGPNCENPSNQMPDGQGALPDAEKQLLKVWICSGAQP